MLHRIVLTAHILKLKELNIVWLYRFNHFDYKWTLNLYHYENISLTIINLVTITELMNN